MKDKIKDFLSQDKDTFSRNEIESFLNSLSYELINKKSKSKQTENEGDLHRCSSYHKEVERHYYTDFEKGFYYARHGKFPPDYEEQEVGVCWGTKECDKCYCLGYRELCDFYPENRSEKSKNK